MSQHLAAKYDRNELINKVVSPPNVLDRRCCFNLSLGLAMRQGEYSHRHEDSLRSPNAPEIKQIR